MEDTIITEDGSRLTLTRDLAGDLETRIERPNGEFISLSASETAAVFTLFQVSWPDAERREI